MTAALAIPERLLEQTTSAAAVVRAALRALKPPPKLTLSEWADLKYYLSPISSAYVGRWRTIGYQRGLMDAFTDPAVKAIFVQKSARVGWTKILNAYVGYCIEHTKSSVLLVQPTIGDAEDYSKEELEPMFEDCPDLATIAFQKEVEQDKKKSNTMTHMRFQGGAIVSLVGAESGRGFRRIGRKNILMDEVDTYKVSAGKDGDPVRLAIKRSRAYHDAKAAAGSTPLVQGESRIEPLFLSGDQRRYFVPCPHCGHMDFFVWTRRETGGHYMVFDKETPENAHFVCFKNGCVIEEKHKRQMIAAGEWRGAKPFKGIASFHVWAAYSLNPGDAWAELVREFLEAKTPEELKTFINTTLGETWVERGDAPDTDPLIARREKYAIGSVPDGVMFITAGVDVQKDRWIYEVVGWSGGDKESWSIDAGVIEGDPSNEADWRKLDELLDRSFIDSAGVSHTITMLAVDSGFATQRVYSWVMTKPRNRVVAVKGTASARTLINKPTTIEVTVNGKPRKAGPRLWLVGSNIAKTEFYGWLRLKTPAPGAEYPPGFVHFPEYSDEWFAQVTAEHQVSVKVRGGRQRLEWHVLPGRQNHWLDCRVYARAAAEILKIERMPRRQRPPVATPATPAASPGAAAPAPAPAQPQAAAPRTPPTSTPLRAIWSRRRGR